MNSKTKSFKRRCWFSVLCVQVLAVGLAFSASGLADADAPVRLTDDGRPVAAIVLPDAALPRRVEWTTAEMLAAHIQRMSGAEIPVVREGVLNATVADGRIVPAPGRVPEGVEAFVLVGEGELSNALEVTAEELGIGGIRVKTTANAIVLLGGPAGGSGHLDPDGVRYAAVELLEHWGWRQIWPGELGLVVPEMPTVEVGALDITYTPAIGRRGMRWGRMRARGETGLERLAISREEWQEGWDKATEADTPLSWSDWQRLGGRMPSFGHAGGGLREAMRHTGHDAEWYMREHPEWFALQGDGTRDQGGDSRFRLCHSNPELIGHVADSIIQRVNENPDIALVSLDFNDGGSNTGWCLCDDCKALDPPGAPPITLTTFNEPIRPGQRMRRRERVEHVSLTDRVAHYWNSVAERVTRVHPDLLFGVSAYSVHSHPPVERQLHPNLVVRYVPSDAERWEGWEKAGARHIFWRPNILLANRRDGKLRSIAGQLAHNMRYFASAGMNQTDFDSIYHHWSTLGLSYFATARLNWNPNLTFDEILADYARCGFGPGAEFVEEYFRRVEDLTPRVTARHGEPDDYVYTAETAAELRGLLNAAEEAAGEDEKIKDRVAFLRLGLNFTELHELLDDKSRRAAAGEAVDMDRARLLVDLNCLVLRDMLHNHATAINVAGLVWGSGTFARWTPVRGRRVMPSDEALLERVGDPRFGLTGREQGIEDMLKAFGME